MQDKNPVAQSTIRVTRDPSSMMFLRCRSPCVKLYGSVGFRQAGTVYCSVQKITSTSRSNDREKLSDVRECMFRGHIWLGNFHCDKAWTPSIFDDSPKRSWTSAEGNVTEFKPRVTVIICQSLCPARPQRFSPYKYTRRQCKSFMWKEDAWMMRCKVLRWAKSVYIISSENTPPWRRLGREFEQRYGCRNRIYRRLGYP